MNWHQLIIYNNVLWRGVGVAAELWLIAILVGMFSALLIGLGRVSSYKTVNVISISWIELFRNTPVLVQLIWFYYALPVLLHTQIPAFEASLLALSLNTSAYGAEIFRSGFKAIPNGQWEAAKALGLSHIAIIRRIILPQVFKSMLPAFTNRSIELAKMTSLCSVLSVHEVMYQGRLLSAAFYNPIQIFTMVALVYFVIISPIGFISQRMEKHLARY